MNFAIDIGHAHGTGSHGHGLDEHTVATHVAALLKNHLTAAGHSVTLIDYPHISNEADLAMAISDINAGDFHAAISLHCDASSNPSAHGAHVCYHATSERGKILAEFVAAPLTRLMPGRACSVQPRPDESKGLSSLAILRQTRPTAILIEMGFISNVEDAAKLACAETIAHALTCGIRDWVKSQTSLLS